MASRAGFRAGMMSGGELCGLGARTSVEVGGGVRGMGGAGVGGAAAVGAAVGLSCSSEIETAGDPAFAGLRKRNPATAAIRTRRPTTKYFKNDDFALTGVVRCEDTTSKDFISVKKANASFLIWISLLG